MCAYINPTVLNIYKYIWHDTLYLSSKLFLKKEKNILSSCSFYFINCMYKQPRKDMMCLIVLVYRKVEVDLYKQPRKDMMCLELDDQILLSITQCLPYSFVQYVRWLFLNLFLCMLLYVNKCAGFG